MALTSEDLHNIKHLFDDRFDAIDRRLDGHDARFNTVNARFDAMDARFDAVNTRFEAADERFGTMDARFTSLDKQLAATRQDISDLADSSKLQFDQVLAGLREVRSDVDVTKDMVKDHGFRITRPEHYVAPPS